MTSHKLKTIKKPKEEKMDMSTSMSMLPSFHVDTKQMPEIKNWEVGKKYRLVVEVEQTSYHEDDHSSGASFNITAYEILNGKNYDEMSDEEIEMEQGKALAS